MKDEAPLHTQSFLNRREMDPFLRNVFPAGFCKNKHSDETMPVRGKLEVTVPRIPPIDENHRDFISIFKQKNRPCDEITDASGSHDARDEYADVAGPFFSDTNPICAPSTTTLGGKHGTSKRHMKSFNKDKGVKLATVYQPTAVFPSLHARPIISSGSCGSPRHNRYVKQATATSNYYTHKPPPDGFILRLMSYDVLRTRSSSCPAEVETVALTVAYHTSFLSLCHKVSELLDITTSCILKLWYFNANGCWSSLERERDWESVKAQQQETTSKFKSLDILYSAHAPEATLTRYSAVVQSERTPLPSPTETGKASFFMMTLCKKDSRRNTHTDPAKLNIMAKTLEQRIISGGY